MVGYRKGIKRKYNQEFINDGSTYGYGNGLIGPPMQRKYVTSKRSKFAITKYANTSFRRSQEIKTLDSVFAGNYASGVYTPDLIQTGTYQMLTINASNCIQALNLCQQGAGISQRVGNKISLKSLRLRFIFEATGKFVPYYSNCRLMVVYDRQPPQSSTYPAVNDLIASVNGANVTVNGFLTDNINPNYVDRLVVLMDEFIPLSPLTSGNSAGTDYAGPTCERSFQINKYINLKNLETTYKGTNATMTVTYISTGALYIIVMGDLAANSEPWQIFGSARLRYRDN